MKTVKRRDRIVDLLRDRGTASVDELAEWLTVSRETVRRDLTKLAHQGVIRKFHGGAAWPLTENEPAFQARMREHAAAKRAIARTAAALFRPGDTLLIDTGTTTVYFAEALSRIDRLRVITNSVSIAGLLGTGNGDTRVFLLGGEYNEGAEETYGPMALEQLHQFHAEHAVLTVGAIEAAGGIMDYDIEETQIARTMIARARKITVLCDASKFNRKALFQVAPLATIHRLVTDRMPDVELRTALENNGVEVVAADHRPTEQ